MRAVASALGDADEHDQPAGKNGGGKQRRPDLHRLPIIGAGEQTGAQAVAAAGGKFTDDGADEAGGDADLHRGEEIGQRDGPAQLDEALPAGGAVGAHEVELDALGRAEALDHADDDREEAEIGRDQRLGDQPGDANGVEHDDDHRRDGEDRHGLAGDDPRHQRAVHGVVVNDEHSKPDAQRRAEEEAEQRRRERDPAVVDEALLGGHGLLGNSLPELGDHLMRRGQQRLLLAPQIANELRGGPSGDALEAVGVDLALIVHAERSRVPDEDDDGDDDEDRNGAALTAHQACSS